MKNFNMLVFVVFLGPSFAFAGAKTTTISPENARELPGGIVNLIQPDVPRGLPELLGSYISNTDARGVAVGDKIATSPSIVRAVVEGLVNPHFVKVPQGFLPPDFAGGELRPIDAFEASGIPVTRELWKEVMGAVPLRVPMHEQKTWSTCPDCPVTYLSFDEEVQKFLARLNHILAPTGCRYNLPSDLQVWYMIRADETGLNTDPYSSGITEDNVDQYITYWGSFNGGCIGPVKCELQPVGKKMRNRFGIELGNAWRLSTDLFDPAVPKASTTVRGGCYNSGKNRIESDLRSYSAGEYRCATGFSLIRTCFQ